MAQKIIRIGSSYGVTLSQSLLEQAGLKYGDRVLLSLDDDGSIKIRSVHFIEDQKFLAQVLTLLEKHQDELGKIDE